VKIDPRNRLTDPAPGDVVLFLHAHPDDESIFTGGTIARLADAGATVVVVMATLGELGVEPDRPDRPPAEEQRALAAIRRSELRDACALLGVSSLHFLGAEGRWSDSGIVPAARAPNALASAAPAAARDLSAILRAVRPHVIVTYASHGCTGHADHRACHEIVRRAACAGDGELARLRSIALVADTGPDPVPAPPRLGAGTTASVDIRGYADTKLAALDRHASQAIGVSAARYRERLLAGDACARAEDYLLVPA
jgi:N-acetyl-1-D-myo-inositol-2-amino-2-deoxy-alpha-D-glucopyranoside deacetylase